MKHLDEYSSLEDDGSKTKYLQSKEIGLRTLRRWKKKENVYRQTEHKRLRSNKGSKPEVVANRGKYAVEEQLLYDEIIQMRAGGRKVSRKWIMLRMKQLLKLSPTDKSRITTGWLTGFLKRKKLSRQKLRNNKKVSVYERIHEVFNFHWYVLYKAQDERPEDPAIFQSSDEESSAEDSTED